MQDSKILLCGSLLWNELGRYAINLNERGNETGVLVVSGKFDREFANLKLPNRNGY